MPLLAPSCASSPTISLLPPPSSCDAHRHACLSQVRNRAPRRRTLGVTARGERIREKKRGARLPRRGRGELTAFAALTHLGRPPHRKRRRSTRERGTRVAERNRGTAQRPRAGITHGAARRMRPFCVTRTSAALTTAGGFTGCEEASIGLTTARKSMNHARPAPRSCLRRCGPTALP